MKPLASTADLANAFLTSHSQDVLTQPTNRTRAFTLIELMVVVVILGILAGVAFSKYGSVRAETQLQLALKECAHLDTIRTHLLSENLLTGGGGETFRLYLSGGTPYVLNVSGGTATMASIRTLYEDSQLVRIFRTFGTVCENSQITEFNTASKKVQIRTAPAVVTTNERYEFVYTRAAGWVFGSY